MNYKEQWQYEGESYSEALEIVHGGLPLPLGALPVVWTVDNDVFVRFEEESDRDDGYIHIGQLEWEDVDDPSGYGEYNISRLRDFVSAWRKERGL